MLQVHSNSVIHIQYLGFSLHCNECHATIEEDRLEIN